MVLTQGNTVQAEGLLKKAREVCESVICESIEREPIVCGYARAVAQQTQRVILKDLIAFFRSIGRFPDMKRLEGELSNLS